MSDSCDIAIVGAGAAGMTAAIFAAEAARADGGPAPRIVLLDGAKSPGAKILVSGGGRCNVTHDHICPDDFNGPKNIVRNVLAAFNEKAAEQWMESIGVQLKREETGKLFPVSDSARTVLASLQRRLAELNVHTRAGCKVVGVDPTFHLECEVSTGPSSSPDSRATAVLSARRLILSTGGKSLPKTGSDGGGWNLARRLGHSVTDTWPALVPLVLDDRMFHADVSGLSHDAELSTFVEGRLNDRRTGSLLWTHFGISGPLAMDASRFWTIAKGRSQAVEMRCSFVPGEAFEKVEAKLIRMAQARPKQSIVKALCEWLPERLSAALLGHAGAEAGEALAQLSRDRRRRIVHALTALPLPIARDRGWNYAEVTAGGVPLDEVDFRTMASRKMPGLFLAGEILDCDGRIGGFNFQWAWATGYLAGRGAVKGLAQSNFP
ncbi:MAG TPA: aminoacetone oxidase family FAD-binding enzyme [Tepidisphaeraceae bacterium]|nr:aminoacetone oxidase family FAD-binding enzyme [Tepidisphaeraceae bacterium]